MYKITLKQGYDDIEFRFDDMANALVFVEKNNEEQKVEVIVEEMNSEDK